jgi:hypothetical protein
MDPTDARDPARFPDDAIGDQLWDLACSGVALSEVRGVTFTIDFPTITSVAVFLADLDEVFADRMQDRIAGQTLDVTLVLALDHATLGAAEAELEDLAEANEAEMMGWAI